MDREVRTVHGLELREADNGPGVLEGYAAVFDSDSVDFGDWVERVAPGAFRDTLADDHDIYALVDHNEGRRLARKRNKTLMLSEDENGLRVSITLPSTTLGQDIGTEVRSGLLDSMSFGFFDRTPKDERWSETSDGRTLRNITSVELLEVSAVTFPAYPATSLAATRALYDAYAESRQHSLQVARSRMRRRSLLAKAEDRLARA